MAGMNYLDFDLEIGTAPDGYRVRVLNSPAGQAEGEFKLPFSDLELENFFLRFGRRTTVRGVESPETTAVRTFGRRLFDAVFTDDLRACLRSSVDQAVNQGNGLRVRLRLNDAPALADLPWEFLYPSSYDRFLTLSVETPLIRYIDLPEPIRPLTVTPPLRVLVMISSPNDYPPLDIEKEWANLSNALGDLEQRGVVKLERLPYASLAALQRQLRQGTYHIFHFVGHGGFDQQAGDGVLVLQDEAGRGHQVNGADLGTILHDHRSLRLAVLNACEGARASRTDPFAGTAQSLVRQGIPAVLAMQFEVSDDAAITLAREFYSALADGYPVDAAVAEARKAIFAQGNALEWGTPVLYMRAPDGKIFDVAALPPQPVSQPIVTPARHAPESVAPSAPTTRRSVTAPAPAQPASSESGSSAPAARRFPKWLIGVVVGGILALCVCIVVVINNVNFSSDTTSNSATPTTGVIEQALANTEPTETTNPPTPTSVPNSGAPSTEPAQQSLLNFAGEWQTNVGTLDLKQDGDQVTGSLGLYGSGADQSVSGTIEGSTLHFNMGFDIYLSADGESFTSNDSNTAMCGVRHGPLPNGCGFSGEWVLRDNSGIVPANASVVLTQIANQVTGKVYTDQGDTFESLKGTVTRSKDSYYVNAQGETKIGEFNWFTYKGVVSFSGSQTNDAAVLWCGWRKSENPDSNRIKSICGF